MNLKKTAIAAALVTAVGTPTVSIADTISMSFTGLFTLIGGVGAINPNSDSAGGDDVAGTRTLVSGTGSFDTTTGAGSATINAFSFFGNGLAEATAVTFQAIGDGFGSTAGSLVAGEMGFNWNGNIGIPVTAIFDAAGFFGSIGAPGESWTVGQGCTGCATSATPDAPVYAPSTLTGGVAIGAIPMAMTTYDTAGTSLGDLFPLTDLPSEEGAIAGVPMTTEPFPGQNAAFDFVTINATNTTVVPVPAAAWLFGSGLLGLVGVARRRRQS